MQDLEKKVIGIILTEKTVASFLLSVSPEEIKKLATTLPIEYNQKNLVDKVDESLQDLGPESEEVEEVVFVFDHHWHDGVDVFADRQKDVNKILNDLSLKDLGFITLEETVAELITNLAPNFSALACIVSRTDIDVNVFRESKQICHEVVGRSGDFKGDMVEAVARLAQACGQDQKYLPHKFILLSLDLTPLELEKLSQEVMEVDWQARGNFLQLPEVEVMPEGSLLNQVVSKVGLVIQKHFIASDLGQVVKTEEVGQAPPVIETETEELEPAEEATEVSEGLNATKVVAAGAAATVAGSLADELVEGNEAEKLVEEPAAALESHEPRVDSDGHQPVTSHQTAVEPTPPSTPAQPLTPQTPAETPETQTTPSQTKPKGFRAWLHRHWHSMDGKSKKPFVAIGVVLGLITLLIWGWFVATKQFRLAVAVTPATKTLTKELTVTLSQTATEVNEKDLILPAKPVTETVEVSDVTQATGEKNVGDKAKGKVKLVNKTTEDKTLSEGTKLITDDSKSLEFKIPATVTIPAATVTDEGDQETKTFGTKEITVEAVEPGEEGNVPKDTKFKVDGVSADEVAAVSLEDFSGGTSKTATIVTEDDLKRLEKRLLEEANKQAEEKFNQSQTATMLFSPPTSQKVLKKEASHKVGEETDEVKLGLTVEVQALSFTKDDLLTLVKNAFAADLPDDLELKEDKIEMLTKFADQEEGQSVPPLVVSATAYAAYKLNPDQIADQIAGRYINEAESVLANDQKIESYEFIFNPSISRHLTKRVPKNKNQFTVVVR